MSISGDDPSTIPDAGRPGRPTGRLQRLLVGVSTILAVAAFVLAATSTVIALRTAGRVDAMTTPVSGDGVEATAESASTAPTTEASASPDVPEPTELPDGDPGTDPTSPPTLDALTQYAVHYTQQDLTLSAPGFESMYADLDEPRADVEAGADIWLRGGSDGPSNLVLGEGVRGSSVTVPQLTPHDCSEKIRTAPLGAEAQVPVRQGVVLCLWTSHSAAVSSGISQLVVQLEITGVAPGGAVTITMDAWKIPR